MQKLGTLKAQFEELHGQFEEAIAQLGDGICPNLELHEQLRSLQEQLGEARDLLVAMASELSLEIPEDLSSLEALEGLSRSIGQVRRKELHGQVGVLLEQVLMVNHREDAVFLALQELKAEASALLSEEADVETLEAISRGEHPFVYLLQLLQENESLTDEEALTLANTIEDAYGRPMAVSVLRGRVQFGEIEQPSLELPAYFGRNRRTITPLPLFRRPRAELSGDAFPSVARVEEAEVDLREEETASDPPQAPSTPVTTPMSLEDFPPAKDKDKTVATGLKAPTTDVEAPAPAKTTDTWEELEAVPAKEEEKSASSSLLALARASTPAPASRAPATSPAPASLATAPVQIPEDTAAFPGAKTAEVPAISEEELEAAMATGEPSNGESETAFQVESPAIEVPSIEDIAVDAMNAVLFPEFESGELGGSLGSSSAASLPRPPSSPKKMSAPTFLTPLPLSVTADPLGTSGPALAPDSASYHEASPLVDVSQIDYGVSSSDFSSVATGSQQMASSSSFLSSPSVQMESYDAMYVRASDPGDFSRVSPLSMWQEHELQKQEHGVAVIFGSSALGLEDLPGFIEMAMGPENLYVIDQIYAPHRFLRQIRQISSRRGGGTMTFVLVTQQTPWDSSWVRGALEMVSQMKSSHRPLRVAFVADPPSTWSMIPSIQPLQHDGTIMLSLEPWHDSALMRWLQQLNFPHEHKIRRSIRRVTGNWSFALKFFYRQMKNNPNQWARHLGSLKQVLESRELAQKALRIMGLTHKTTLSILHKLTLEEPATQESMERAFAHAPPRLITRALLWAERLSLVQYENYFWSTNPLVARLLKALR